MRYALRVTRYLKNMNMEELKKLRESTGAGMVDCKKALEEANGDFTKAIEILRKKGIAKAAKRGERDAKEGIIKIKISSDGKTGYILEINSETDFVAKNEKFQELADKIINLIQNENPRDLDALLALKMENGTVKENVENLSGVIGEKLGIKNFNTLKSSGRIAGYSHLGGRIGVLAALDKDDQDLAYEIAMQVAAANPKYIQPEDVAKEELAKEREIYLEQLKKEGKPEQIIEKILAGKINKYCEDICLVKQEYIKDDKKKVGDILGNAKVEKFIRYSL